MESATTRPRVGDAKGRVRSRSLALDDIQKFQLSESQKSPRNIDVDKLLEELRVLVTSLKKTDHEQLKHLLETIQDTASPRTLTLSNTRAILTNTQNILNNSSKQTEAFAEDIRTLNEKTTQLSEKVDDTHGLIADLLAAQRELVAKNETLYQELVYIRHHLDSQ